MNSEDLETLHLLAFPFDRKLKTVRDLNDQHLPLLKSIRDETYKVIEEKYGFKRTHLRAFFHYHPTFYHLHVHFTHIN